MFYCSISWVMTNMLKIASYSIQIPMISHWKHSSGGRLMELIPRPSSSSLSSSSSLVTNDKSNVTHYIHGPSWRQQVPGYPCRPGKNIRNDGRRVDIIVPSGAYWKVTSSECLSAHSDNYVCILYMSYLNVCQRQTRTSIRPRTNEPLNHINESHSRENLCVFTPLSLYKAHQLFNVTIETPGQARLFGS